MWKRRMSDRTDNVCCVRSRQHSSMPTPPQSQRQLCRGVGTRCRRRRASESESPPVERSGMMAG